MPPFRPDSPLRIWFWQNILSPHVAGLASALADCGHHVVFLSSGSLGHDRAKQGWVAASPAPAVSIITDGFADQARRFYSAPPGTHHIVQGLRGNPVLALAARRPGTGQHLWVLTEEFDHRGLLGLARRWRYATALKKRSQAIEGLLVCGDTTRASLQQASSRPTRIYPFNYFLRAPAPAERAIGFAAEPFRFVTVGQMIRRKRVDLAIAALAELQGRAFEFWLAGDGPGRPEWLNLASQRLGSRCVWKNVVPMPEVPRLLAQCDCLILSSDFDGWGAVVNEALQAGTRVIASDNCGSRALLKSLPDCDIFEAGSKASLLRACERQLALGKVTDQARTTRVAWADLCISARAGARYLETLLQSSLEDSPAPPAPWEPPHVGWARAESAT